MKFGIVLLPGSNCDHDAVHVTRDVLGHDAELIWHRDRDLRGADCVVIPGGFSYGDYLRAGAIAKFAPIMETVREFAGGGGLVIGICNGFQILTELGLLPGALMRNSQLRFAGHQIRVRTETTRTPFTCTLDEGNVLRLEIAHGEGHYYADEATLDELAANDQIVFRYCDAAGDPVGEANPNGSSRNIAGVVNRERNVMGLMPHPERSSEEELGSADGLRVFQSIATAFAGRATDGSAQLLPTAEAGLASSRSR